MKKSLSVMCASSILMIAGCRKEEPAPVVDPAVQETTLVASTDTNQAFTPPEIRRAYDSTRRGADSAALAASAKKPDTVAVAAPAAPAPAPAAAPVPPPPAPAPKAPEPKPAPAPAPKVQAPSTPVAIPAGIVEPGGDGDWVIQVGIHKSEEGAQGKVEKLAGIGISAYVVQAATNAGLSGSYWRVRVGRWVKRADAQAYGENVLKPAGYNFWVDRKSNELASAGGNP